MSKDLGGELKKEVSLETVPAIALFYWDHSLFLGSCFRQCPELSTTPEQSPVYRKGITAATLLATYPVVPLIVDDKIIAPITIKTLGERKGEKQTQLVTVHSHHTTLLLLASEWSKSFISTAVREYTITHSLRSFPQCPGGVQSEGKSLGLCNALVICTSLYYRSLFCFRSCWRIRKFTCLTSSSHIAGRESAGPSPQA
jgi:hypothetical protein